MKHHLPELKNKPLYEKVADEIESLILKGQYQKGDLLPSEKELMASTGVSRITVREGLRTLAELGIIQTYKGKGSVVLLDQRDLIQQPQKKELFLAARKAFEESTEIRILIEPEIAKSATVNASPQDLARIREAYENSVYQRDADVVDGEVDLFHRCIILCCNNSTLLGMFDNLTEIEDSYDRSILIPPNNQPTYMKEFNEHHQKILGAMEAGNPEFAYFYMKEHLLFLRDTYADYFGRFYF